VTAGESPVLYVFGNFIFFDFEAIMEIGMFMRENNMRCEQLNEYSTAQSL
jgi:hypothetical protein